jgi:hypothetical protein
MKSLIHLFLLALLGCVGASYLLMGQTKPTLPRPNLPMNIPPPPSFASLVNKSGKFQIISAEYYSEDAKPFLYKRLVKLDTSTGEAWVLSSKIGLNGELRRWVSLETEDQK